MVIQVEQLVAAFVKMRDAKAALDEGVKKEKKKLVDGMDMITSHLQKQLDNLGVKSIKTDAGTVFKTKKEYVGVEDFELFLDFLLQSVVKAAEEVRGFEPSTTPLLVARELEYIKENANLQFLNKVINKSAVLQWMEDHENDLPPGAKYTTESVVQVRR